MRVCGLASVAIFSLGLTSSAAADDVVDSRFGQVHSTALAVRLCGTAAWCCTHEVRFSDAPITLPLEGEFLSACWPQVRRRIHEFSENGWSVKDGAQRTNCSVSSHRSSANRHASTSAAPSAD